MAGSVGYLWFKCFSPPKESQSHSAPVNAVCGERWSGGQGMSGDGIATIAIKCIGTTSRRLCHLQAHLALPFATTTGSAVAWSWVLCRILLDSASWIWSWRLLLQWCLILCQAQITQPPWYHQQIQLGPYSFKKMQLWHHEICCLYISVYLCHVWAVCYVL